MPGPSPNLKTALERTAASYTGPILAFDRDAMERRLAWLSACERDYGIHFLMAAKAFRSREVYALANRYLSGFDVSNAREYDDLPQPGPNRLIMVTDPASFHTPIRAPETGGDEIYYNASSMQQLRQLGSLKEPVNIGVRLRIDDLRPFAGNTAASRFGLGVDELEEARNHLAQSGKRIAGLHIHDSLRKNDRRAFLEYARQLMSLVDRYELKPDYIDLGGGLQHVPESQRSAMFEEVRALVPPHIKVVFEPGAFLSHGLGYGLTEVKDRRLRGPKALDVTVDLSAECHLKWSRPKINAPIEEAKKGKGLRVRIFGPTCYEHDLLGVYSFTGEAEALDYFRPGRKLIFSGVWGYSVSWMTSFNGVPEAAVRFV